MFYCFYNIFLFLCISYPTEAFQPEDLISDTKKFIVISDFEKVLSKEQVKEDLDYLSYAVSYAWAAKWLKPLEVNNVLDEFKSLSQESSSKSIESLHEAISKSMSLVPDNHSGVDPLMSKGKKNYASKTNFPQVGMNLISGSDKPYRFKWDKVGDDDILVLAIKEFVPDFNNKIWNDFKNNLTHLLKKSKGLVIDLRYYGTGARGGDNNPGFFLAKHLWGKRPGDHADRYHIKTLEALALSSYTREGYEKRKTEVKSRPVLIDKSKYLDPQKISKDLGPKGYKYPIVILIDKASGSADEELVASLKDHPNVYLVGQNTAGTYHCGNSHALILPNSNIMINLSTMYRKSRDEKFIERVGFSPDIKLKEGTNAYTYIKKDWEDLKKRLRSCLA